MAIDRPWLVTGAAGFLGSHVVEQLLGQGESVLALDNLAWGRWEYLQSLSQLYPQKLQIVIADIRQLSGILPLFRAFSPFAVIHLAALHFIPAAEADPSLALTTNVIGTQVILEAAMSAGVRRIWFASTGDVYPPSEAPHREDDPPGPFNVYGLSKLQGEQLIGLHARRHPDRHWVIGRLFNLYGLRETNPHILPEIFQQIRAQWDKPDPLTLQLGNLWPRRDMVPTEDAARAVIALTQQAQPGLDVFNVATGVARSIQDLLDRLAQLLNRPIHVVTDPARVRPVERSHLQADVEKLRSKLGWTPGADLGPGLGRLAREAGLPVDIQENA